MSRGGGIRPVPFLDGLRGLAAFYVMTGHARWLLWEGSEAFQRHESEVGPLSRCLIHLSAAFRYGHEAVMFFFVLSGFVIHMRSAQAFRLEGAGASFHWQRYLWHRARRLYPPLLGAMILTYVLDRKGMALGYPIYFQQTHYELINRTIFATHDMATALGNLVFMMSALVSVWGTNGPLWSLHFEWWFYMVYPGLWWLSRKSLGRTTILILMLFCLSPWIHSVLVQPALAVFLAALLSWWLGTLLSEVYFGRIGIPRVWIPMLALLLLVLPFVPRWPSFLRDLLWAVAFCGLISLCLEWEGSRVVRVLERLKPLGDFSYTLYVTHFPLLVFFSGFLMSRSAGYLPADLRFVPLGMAGACLLAWTLHWLLERPFLSRRNPVAKLGFSR